METIKEEKAIHEIPATSTHYKSICISIYEYKFGMIGFLDLIERSERILGISSPQTSFRKTTQRLE